MDNLEILIKLPEIWLTTDYRRIEIRRFYCPKHFNISLWDDFLKGSLNYPNGLIVSVTCDSLEKAYKCCYEKLKDKIPKIVEHIKDQAYFEMKEKFENE